MNKLEILAIIAMILLLSVIGGCNNNPSYNTNESQASPITPIRIKLIEEVYLNNTWYHIIEVDSIQYLATYHGGITPLIKK